jgi:hypothetical protein
LGRQFGPGPDSELCEDVFEVGLYGSSAHDQSLRNLGVGEAFGYQFDYLVLGGGETGPAMEGAFAFSSGSAGIARRVGPGDSPTLGLGGGYRVGVQLVSGGVEGVIDRLLLMCEAPLVVALGSQPQGRTRQTQAFCPALGTTGSDGQPFEGVDDQKS